MVSTIRSQILLLIIGLVAVTSLTFTFVTTRNYHSEITGQYHKQANDSVASVLQVIDTEYNDLLNFELTTIKNQRALMESVGNGMLSLVETFYNRQISGELDELSAKKQCLEKIGQYRYQDNHYFFVCNTDLVGLAHPVKTMVGRKWAEFQDIRKEGAFSLVQRIIKNKRRTFTVMMWPRPGDMKQVKQLGLFFYFPPWEWIIGTAYQISDIEEKSKEKETYILSKLNKVIEQMSINEVGGILVFNSRGKVLVHTSHLPGSHDYMVLSEQNMGAVQKQIVTGYKENKGPIQYRYPGKGREEIIQTAYVRHYKYLDWYIVSFVDRDALKEPGSRIAARQLFLLLVVLVLGIAFAIFISGRISSPLRQLASYARDQPMHGFGLERTQELESIRSRAVNKETRRLTEAFVFMESEIARNVEQLNEHRKHLEELVAQRTSELTDTNARLLTSEQKLQAVLSASPIGIGLVIDRKLNWANEMMYELVGYERDSLFGEGADILYPDRDEFERVGTLLYSSMKESKIGQVETRWIRKDGTVLDCILRLTSLYPSDPSKGQIVTVIDVTDFKEAEREKIKAQKVLEEEKKLALVGQIAGKMAHDFNNVLGIILGNAELALIHCEDPGTVRFLELIKAQTLRGRGLTRNLIAFAKDQEPQQVYFRVHRKIQLVLKLLQKELEGIMVMEDHDPLVPELLADPGMIEHALVNLIQNAVHAVSLSENPQIHVSSTVDGQDIVIKIADNGCGIPEDSMKSIYEPAFTLKGSKDLSGSYGPEIRGTGYGLANVKKYIEQHSGSIEIESEVGTGTTFLLRFPVIKKQLSQEEKKSLEEGVVHYGKYILLVEDEIDISNVQYQILTEAPCLHRVDVASNGTMAIDLINRNDYDLISLDYILPGGCNGMDVYTHIRDAGKSVPILFVSGNIEFLEKIQQLKDRDNNIEHLSKPCQNIEYVNRINFLLEKSAIPAS